MSGWGQGWKSGSYWGTPRRNPKAKGNRPRSPKPQKPEKPKDVLPGYDSEKWLPSAQSSSSQSGASEVPQNIVELTKILRTVVEAGKIELPKEAMALLSNQAEAEVKTEMQKEQKILNAKRKLMAKIGRLKDAMENKKVKFRTYKAAIKEQLAKESERFEKDLESIHPEAAKIVNLHFPLIYIFARIYIPNLRKLKGKCKFYIFPKNAFFRRKLEDLCKNENFHFFLHTKNYYFFSIFLVSSLDFWSLLAVIVPWTI